MCHVSVGHVGRAIEEAGIATTAVYVRAFGHVVDEMKLPRVLITNHKYGACDLGFPRDDQVRLHRTGSGLVVDGIAE